MSRRDNILVQFCYCDSPSGICVVHYLQRKEDEAYARWIDAWLDEPAEDAE